MKIRQVVTGHTPEGKSIVASDSEVEGVQVRVMPGSEVHLRPGDTVVQNGTRHAWHNRGFEPCVMVACLIGVHRKQ